MPERSIHFRGFEFPERLPNRKANFRFVIDVRYKNEKGSFVTENVVMPGLDTFWECDTEKAGNPNYVRSADGASRFDPNRIDDWDKLVLRCKAEELYMLRVKVFDVDRQDFWDKFLDAVSKLIGAAVGKLKGATAALPGVGDVLGSISDELNSSIAKKLAGGDQVLFKGSAPLTAGDVRIQDRGSTDGDRAGDYTVLFEVT